MTFLTTITTSWYRFRAIYRCLERRTELARLIAWAERKKLTGPRDLYYSRRADEELRLLHYTVRHPRTLAWARRLLWVSALISPPRRYYLRGAAARYRRISHPARRGILRFSF